MKNAQKRIRKIDAICNRNFIIALLILLGGVPILLHSIVAPQPDMSVVEHLFMVLAASMLVVLPLYSITVVNVRLWEKLFSEEFPGIKIESIKNTVRELNAANDSSHSFSSVAKAVVLSLEDESCGNTLPQDSIVVKVKKIYRSFLPQTK